MSVFYYYNTSLPVNGAIHNATRKVYNCQPVNFMVQCKLLSTLGAALTARVIISQFWQFVHVANQLHKCAQMLKSVIFEVSISCHFNKKILI